MEELILFLNNYGWQLAIIALIGVVILGVLKYTNAFSKIEKEKRKPVYFAISIGFSFIATVIYLLVIKKFTIEYVVTISAAIYALNQTFYAIYETTTLRDLICRLLDFIKEKIKTKQKQ